MIEEKPLSKKFEDPILKRNYYIIRNYLISLVDLGLDYLKTVYVSRNADTSFQEFAADNYYDYILRDYMRRKIKSQIKMVLKGAILSLDHYDNKTVDPKFLDDLIAKTFEEYSDTDMILLHSDPDHEARGELELISKLTYRVAIIQATHLMANRDEAVSNHRDLVLSTYPTLLECKNSLDAIFNMFDQIIDCFERNLDMINIAFYKPTWRIRNFAYARKIYEFALSKANEELRKLYNGSEHL